MRTGVRHDVESRCPDGALASPVDACGEGDADEKGATARAHAEVEEEAYDLDGLAKPHLIREYDVAIVCPIVLEPVQTTELIRVQLAANDKVRLLLVFSEVQRGTVGPLGCLEGVNRPKGS